MNYLEDLKAHESEIKRRFHVKRIGLYGSAINPNKKNPRDVDILVEFDQPTFDNFMDLSAFLEDVFQKKVDLVSIGGLNPYFGPQILREVIWCG